MRPLSHDNEYYRSVDVDTDELTADGKPLKILFFRHASLGFVWNGLTIYVDPLAEYADYASLPAADLVLVTHEHYDHLDLQAIDAATGSNTVIIASRAAAEQIPAARALSPGEEYRFSGELRVKAVPAYNVSPEQLQFHPRERGDNGYLIYFGPTVVYIAGDTEPIAEMKDLGKVDIAFLPVNQPYTMKPQQIHQAAQMVAPTVLYPYHTTDTDIAGLKQVLSDLANIDVRYKTMP